MLALIFADHGLNRPVRGAQKRQARPGVSDIALSIPQARDAPVGL
jgi:hypothetical protein